MQQSGGFSHLSSSNPPDHEICEIVRIFITCGCIPLEAIQMTPVLFYWITPFKHLQSISNFATKQATHVKYFW